MKRQINPMKTLIFRFFFYFSA
ncbi:pheST operon leader peptide PheM [Moellerella wisconsensis]